MASVLTACVSMTYLPLVGLVFLLSLFLKSCFWLRVGYHHQFPLSKIPGPRLAAWSRLWIVKALASGRSHEVWTAVNKEHGSLARIGPNHLITDDPEIMRRVLEVRSSYRRGPWFDSIKTDAFLENIASTRDPKQHAAARSRLAPSFKCVAVRKAEAGVDMVILDWIDRVKKTIASNSCCPNVIDIGKQIQYLTLDIITKILLGHQIGCVASEGDVHNFLSDVEKANFFVQFMSVITELTVVLRWLSSLPLVGRFFRAEPNNGNGTGRLIAFINTILQDRQESGHRVDVVSSLLKGGMTPRQISSELLVALVAGSDTAATAVQYTILAIMTNPQVYYTLKTEIRLALECKVGSQVIQDDECKQLPYLHACVMEGLRKFPPLAQLREREVGKGGDVINGYFVPEGTFVGLNVRGAQLRRDIYGGDAELFRPERWFEHDESRLKAMYQTHELIFGYGSTKCLGYSIAMMETNKLVFEIFRNFDLSVAEAQKPWKSTCHGMFFQKDFNVVIHSAEYVAPPAYSRPASPAGQAPEVES